jgi:chemotaxis methyl-accepting protein methylase
MFLGTYFLRNRPELQLIRELSRSARNGRAAKIAVLGCSNGAEVYSIAWVLRSAEHSAPLSLQAVDISPEAVTAGREGVYSFGISELVREPVLERMTPDELTQMFDRDGSRLRVKPWIKEGITWQVGDAGDPELVDKLGPQDIVVANRFLCHMVPRDAERCLRNIARLVAPGRYLFVSGVDLDVRTKVASELGWKPVAELLEEIHEGDARLRLDWPCKYWGLEPLDKNRSDWRIRYASVFQIGQPT